MASVQPVDQVPPPYDPAPARPPPPHTPPQYGHPAATGTGTTPTPTPTASTKLLQDSAPVGSHPGRGAAPAAVVLRHGTTVKCRRRRRRGTKRSSGKGAYTAPPAPDVAYVASASGPVASLFVRADGVVDRSKGGGKVSHHVVPPAGERYTAVSVGTWASYILRSSGVVDRLTRRGKVTAAIAPPPGERYTAVTSGDRASYFLRNTGVVDETRGGGAIKQSFRPPPGLRYTGVSTGTDATYLTRSDGVVTRLGTGSVTGTIARTCMGQPRQTDIACAVPSASATPTTTATTATKGCGAGGAGTFPGDGCGRPGYTAVSTQVPSLRDQPLVVVGGVAAACVLTGGAVFAGLCIGAAVTAASTGANKFSMLVRSDGKVDVTRGGGKVECTLTATPATTSTPAASTAGAGAGARTGPAYVAATCGPSCSYLLTSDGRVELIDHGVSDDLRRLERAARQASDGTRQPHPVTPRPLMAPHVEGRGHTGGVVYTHISTGRFATYLTRSDGKIDMIRSGGVVKSTIEAQPVPVPVAHAP